MDHVKSEVTNPSNMNTDKSGERIGHRIKQIRDSKGLSRAELGSMVGLDQNRVQQYENGTRKPKYALLQGFANALAVNIRALSDPVCDGCIGAMYSLFDMADQFGGIVFEKYGFDVLIRFRSSEMQNHLSIWRRRHEQYMRDLNRAREKETRDQITLAYKNWKWNYGNNDKMTYRKVLEDQQRELKEQLKEIERELKGIEFPDQTGE